MYESAEKQGVFEMTRVQNCGNCNYAGKDNKPDNTKYCLVKHEDVKCAGICGYYMQQHKSFDSGAERLNDAV